MLLLVANYSVFADAELGESAINADFAKQKARRVPFAYFMSRPLSPALPHYGLTTIMSHAPTTNAEGDASTGRCNRCRCTNNNG